MYRLIIFGVSLLDHNPYIFRTSNILLVDSTESKTSCHIIALRQKDILDSWNVRQECVRTCVGSTRFWCPRLLIGIMITRKQLLVYLIYWMLGDTKLIFWSTRKTEKKIGSVGRQNKNNIIWFLGPVFFKK